ncbi:hypothetical protein LEP1GSC083_2101 [Leptospira interrogans serovar Pyrogenes str. L0374]|uniref:Uncharacterized protein n=1 Tax=Leptospira interrogans serovar Pyrogenes str. L0374 TaxID=1049928 RepID=M6KGA9_LEPIR|nr:hypothetical protein LEP1GSC083_2101 [Leptospira interrogans serovar Pyrogenes str. L0374]
MAAKQRFCAKIGWTMILLVFHSSHNFQSLTGKSATCESSHILFFYEKIDLG